MKRNIHVCLLLSVFGLLSVAGASAQRINRIIFFGDSLSDAGNHFLATHQVTVPPYTLDPPTASYPIGWFHFSNGRTWAEQVADNLRLPASGAPSLLLPGIFTDYAVGRARARDGGDPQFPTFFLSAQVDSFLADFHGHVPQNSLVVILIGSNDVDDAINAFLTDPNCAPSPNASCSALGILYGAYSAVANNIVKLYAAGARMFLIGNAPSIATTPYVSFLGANVSPAIPLVAGMLTQGYDSALAQIVRTLPSQLPPDQRHPLAFMKLLNIYNFLANRVLVNPGAYGFSNVFDPSTQTFVRCTVPGVLVGAVCSSPDTYLFWDAAHPTTAGHRVLAEAALGCLKGGDCDFN